jgi:hypothetical protein
VDDAPQPWLGRYVRRRGIGGRAGTLGRSYGVPSFATSWKASNRCSSGMLSRSLSPSRYRWGRHRIPLPDTVEVR